MCVAIKSLWPCNNRYKEEKKKFWNSLGYVVNVIGNGYKLNALININKRISIGVRDGMAEDFGVPNEIK